MNKVAYNYLYLAVDKDFSSFSEGCFFMKEQSVTNGESILVLYSSPKCSEEGARLRVLCRSEASQSVIYFGAKTERFGGKSSRAFCNKGYATVLDTDLEALKVLRLEHYDADIDGIWVNIAVVGVNANNTIGVNLTLAIPVPNPNESSNMWIYILCFAAVSVVIIYLIYKRLEMQSYHNLVETMEIQKQKESEMKEVKLNFEVSVSKEESAIRDGEETPHFKSITN